MKIISTNLISNFKSVKDSKNQSVKAVNQNNNNIKIEAEILQNVLWINETSRNLNKILCEHISKLLPKSAFNSSVVYVLTIILNAVLNKRKRNEKSIDISES